ncbi:MAG: iron-containing alcohol dehydrogenase [Rickettsiales bacterium]
MPHLLIAPRISSFRAAIGNQLGESILMVCDANTYNALGKRIASEYASSAMQILQLETPKASLQAASAISEKLDAASGILAVGSGTLNDLCKYAAFQKNVPYAVAATAPSMNGFVSPTASLIPESGQINQSYNAAPPVAVLADLETLAAAAPVRLIRSGLGIRSPAPPRRCLVDVPPGAGYAL